MTHEDRLPNQPERHTPSRESAEPAERLFADFRRAITAYARYRDAVARHERLMSLVARVRADTAETRLVVEAQSARRREELEARERVRAVVRRLAHELRASGQSLDAVLQQTGGLLRPLRDAGTVPDETGVLEAEVMRWAAEEYCRIG